MTNKQKQQGENRMVNALLYDLQHEHYKIHFVSEFCDNCVSFKPTRIIVTKKLQRFFLCDNCATNLHYLKTDLKKENTNEK